MSKRKSSKRQGKSPDPYLRAFLRQAVAIIATEKGLNDSSRPKLRALALQLGLSDDAYRVALEKLQRRNPTLGLNRYEKQFVEMLSGEMEKISGDILTIKAENKAIDLAERRYQIPEIRAHQLLEETAERYGVATISHHDAELFATSLIDEAIENRIWLREEDRKRLQHACQKWGMAEHEVEQAIRARFVRNRGRRGKNVLSALVAGSGTILFLASLIYGASQIKWEVYFAPNKKNKVETVKAPRLTESKLPKWIDNQVYVTLQQAIATDQRLEHLLESGPWKVEQRELTYLELMDVALSYPNPNPAVNELAAKLYSNEPNQSLADTLLSQVKQALANMDAKRISSASQLRQALAASDLLAAMVFNTPDSKKKTNQLNRMLLDLGISAPADSRQDLQNAIENRLLEKSWQNLLSHLDQNAAAIGLLPELERKSKDDRSPLINTLRTSAVMQLLRRDPNTWTQIQTSIKQSIANSDLSTATRWIEELDQIPNRSLNEMAVFALASRLDLNLNQSNDSLVAELQEIRKRNRYRGYNREVESAIVVDNAVHLVEMELAKLGIENESGRLGGDTFHHTELILKCMCANNIALKWIQSANQNEFSSFAGVSTVAKELSFFPLESKSSIRSKPTPFEKRRMKESISKLVESEKSQTFSRVSAIQALVKISAKFEDIGYEDAKVLARRIINPNSQREALELERALPSFSQWPNLKLALADQISIGSSVDLAAMKDHLQLLDCRLDKTSDSHISISRQILKHVAADINRRHRDYIPSNHWIKISPRIRKLLVQRGKILGPSAAVNHDPLEIYLRGVASAANEYCNINQPLQRLSELISDKSILEPEKLVLANRLLSEIFRDGENGMPNQHLKWEELLDSNNTLTHGQRILMSELILMKQLSRFRQEWMESVQ